jgi:hypothetical protein
VTLEQMRCLAQCLLEHVAQRDQPILAKDVSQRRLRLAARADQSLQQLVPARRVAQAACAAAFRIGLGAQVSEREPEDGHRSEQRRQNALKRADTKAIARAERKSK